MSHLDISRQLPSRHTTRYPGTTGRGDRSALIDEFGPLLTGV
ncbi:MAG: hypothetical protein QOG10_5864, partial [Kribbellaceae bacterium]|nr:hypothetical protein [Kribbellaceae bacterium]